MSVFSFNCKSPFALSAALLGAIVGLAPEKTSLAQESAVPPAVRIIDSNGVDVISRKARRVGPVISTAGIAVDKGGFRSIQYDNFHIGYVATSSEEFIRYGDGSIYPGTDGSHMGSQGFYTASGELIKLDYSKSSDGFGRYAPILAMASQIIKPDGEVLTFYYKSVTQAHTSTRSINIYLPQAVVSSLGWMAKYEYDINGTFEIPILSPKKVYLINTSIDYCDPVAETCTGSNSAKWPTFNYSNMTNNYSGGCTDAMNQPYICGDLSGGYKTPMGVNKGGKMFLATSLSDPATVTMGDRTWKYIYEWNIVKQSSGAYADKFKATTYNPDGSYKVFYSKSADILWTSELYPEPAQKPAVYGDITNSAYVASLQYYFDPVKAAWSAAWLVNYPNFTISMEDELVDVYPSQPHLVVDELGRKTEYEYYENNTSSNGDNRSIKRVISPEATYTGTTLTGGYTEYTYDARRNITSISVFPKGGGVPLVTSYEYEATCTDTNYRFCNKVKKITDPKGGITDYTYSVDHGGLLTETFPADSSGKRPQNRYFYTALYAQIKSSTGTTAPSATPVWRLTKKSSCMDASISNPSSCIAPSSETVTEYAYNHNNLLLTSETVRAGDNSVSATTSYTYDYVGNVVSVDGPLAGTVDKIYTTYDIRRRKVYEIGADPDGADVLKRSVIRHTYDLDGNEILTEYGTGNTIVFDSVGVPTGVSDFSVTNFKRMTFNYTTGELTKTEVGQP